jgi:ribosomal protein S18 acetylase RimI-like enzyme
MNEISIVEESAEALPEYIRIPATFEVRSVFEVQPIDHGLGGLTLTEQRVDPPWIKNYDDLGENPADWPTRWDTSKWGILSAYVDASRVGGCTIAYDTPSVHKLGDRKDIAVLWDIRIHPDFRGQGIGARLLDAAAAWTAQRHCLILTAETQNNNVPACRFYTKQGFTLGAVTRFAYAELPDEVELVWYKEL